MACSGPTGPGPADAVGDSAESRFSWVMCTPFLQLYHHQGMGRDVVTVSTLPMAHFGHGLRLPWRHPRMLPLDGSQQPQPLYSHHTHGLGCLSLIVN